MSATRVPFDPAGHPLFDRLVELNLDRDHFAIFGSAPLYARGIIPSIRDLDIIACGPAWQRARRLGTSIFGPSRAIPIVHFWGGKIEVFSEWQPRCWETETLIDEAEWLSGFKFVRLECVLTYKYLLQRPKDLLHLAQIRSCLASEKIPHS